MTPTMFTCEAFVEVKKNNTEALEKISDTANRLGVDEAVARQVLEQQGSLNKDEEETYYEYFNVAFDLCSISRVEEYVMDDETCLATAISDNPKFFYHLNVDFRVFVEVWVKAKTGKDEITCIVMNEKPEGEKTPEN
jgi:hypothetical protein